MFPQIERTKTTFTRNAESSKKKKRNIKLRERKNASIYHFANFIGQKKKKTWKYSRRSGPLFFFSLLKTAKKVVFHERKTQKAHTQKKKLVYIASPHRITQAPQHFFFLVFVNAKRKLSRTPQAVKAKWKSSTVKHDAERCPFSSRRIKKKKKEKDCSLFFLFFIRRDAIQQHPRLLFESGRN